MTVKLICYVVALLISLFYIHNFVNNHLYIYCILRARLMCERVYLLRVKYETGLFIKCTIEMLVDAVESILHYVDIQK